MKKGTILIAIMGLVVNGYAQTDGPHKFKQLYEELPTPTVYRTGSGAPGHSYYQMQADYKIKVKLDDEQQKVFGEETITYHNNSPDALSYLWVQLDQNMRARGSDSKKISTRSLDDGKMSFNSLQRMHNDFDGGFKLEYVRNSEGEEMNYVVNKTMMRIDLEQPLSAGSVMSFSIKWRYNINDRMEIGGRSGYEYFEEDGNYLYTIAQFYPRMAVYNETEGWQNKQFLGRGEFTLPFGDYEVEITAPSDHVVAATGILQNTNEMLSGTQRERWIKAKTSNEPVMIVTEKEAEKAEKKKAGDEKTWKFKAQNVRDFAFASSRKFIWDAQVVKFGDRTVMAMSYYPKEGNPLWERYSTKAVAHTLKVYSKHTFDYPYPVAISVHTDRIGMEYPMICFNGGRPEPDGTYTERTKYGMISVIIHEVGHNYFPMIVNSDERQWTWMDEGLNSFLQYLTEKEWDRDYPSRRGPAYKIVDYMKGEDDVMVPIMTNSESILQFGNNAYGKPATALNILRETVMGPELFDHAFKVYAQRWMFKHPNPADFFRTMEDASAVDLDWFWRGWFYTTDHVDISLENATWYRLDTKDPKKELAWEKQQGEKQYISDMRNKERIAQSKIEGEPELKDFYNNYDPYEPNVLDYEVYDKYLEDLSEEEKSMLNERYNYYQLDFKNVGGLVMPLILQFEFIDGTTEVKRIPAEVWRKNTSEISTVFYFEKQVQSVTLDPFLETADTDVENNHWPRKVVPSRFELYKREQDKKNTMQKLEEKGELKKYQSE